MAKSKKLNEGERQAHGDKLLKEGKKIHAGAFLWLGDARPPFLLTSFVLIVDHIYEMQMLDHHIKNVHGKDYEYVFTPIMLCIP